MSAPQRLSCGLISPIIVAAAAAISGCSDTTVADHAACKAKAYEVFKVSPEKSDAYDDVDVKFKQCVTAIKSAADLQTCRDARNKALAVPDALDHVRLCMISAGYRETDICIEKAQASGQTRSYSWIGHMASCFERSWWNGWGEWWRGVI